MSDQDQKQPEIDAEQDAPEAVQAAEEATQVPEEEIGVEAPEEGESADDRLSQLEEEVGQAKDLALRAQAEAQNVKRRAEMDVEKARKFALESFSRDLLPVVDNLERALESAAESGEDAKPLVEGVELTLKSLLEVLAKHHVAPVDPQGEPFDPQLHQAMSMVENPDVEPNTVIAVMQKGYTLNDRLLRPAMVMVSKAAG